MLFPTELGLGLGEGPNCGVVSNRVPNRVVPRAVVTGTGTCWMAPNRVGNQERSLGKAPSGGLLGWEGGGWVPLKGGGGCFGGPNAPERELRMSSADACLQKAAASNSLAKESTESASMERMDMSHDPHIPRFM